MKKITLCLAICMLSNLTFAADYVLNLTNNTGMDLHQIFVSEGSSEDWEDDILDENEVLAAGETFELTLEDYDQPVFDVLGIAENGNEYVRYDVDIEKNDVKLTEKDLDTKKEE